MIEAQPNCDAAIGPLAIAQEMPPSDSRSKAGAGLFVSVIIPVRNDAERLRVCLKSLARQTYPRSRLEVVVVDNGSTDESVHVAKQYGATVIEAPELRVGGLRNRGVVESIGEILAFVDSDHELPENWIASGVARLTSSSDVRMIGAPCRSPASGTWVQRFWELHRLRRRERHETAWLGAGNMFLRRCDFERVGGFREDLVAAEDVDLCTRIGRLPGKIVCDPAVVNVHHGEPRTLWQFFRKELWRGSSGLRAFFTQGMPLRDLPSLLYPAYYLVATLALVVAIGSIPFGPRVLPLAAAIAALLLPATVLALKTSFQVHSLAAVLPLVVLYLVYGLARAAALFKR
jgi:glycosyltransferase involved in cell wall biosynthesis